MTKEELIQKLKDIKKNYSGDQERDHIDADEFLLEFIDDEEVKEAYDDILKWYA